jgi:hypothetical protein
MGFFVGGSSQRNRIRAYVRKFPSEEVERVALWLVALSGTNSSLWFGMTVELRFFFTYLAESFFSFFFLFLCKKKLKITSE